MWYDDKSYCVKYHTFEACPGETLCVGCQAEEINVDYILSDIEYEREYNEVLRKGF